MNYKKQLLTAFSALALATGVFGVPAQAAKARCTSEECACERALRQNTVEALEKFLKRYPHSEGTACSALAVPPQEDGVDGQSKDDDQVRNPTDSTSYGG